MTTRVNTVTLLALDLDGVVTACMQNEGGSQYCVVWYWDGVRRSEWLHAFEIKPHEAI